MATFVAFAVAVAHVGLAASALPRSGHYVGKTSERAVASLPQATVVSFTVSPDGREILSFSASLGYNGVCGQGGGPEYTVKVPRIPLRAGQFEASTQGFFHTLRMPIRVAGTVSGASAHGTVGTAPPSRCPPPNASKINYRETFTAAAH